jgi:uncharacterized membrane protein
MLRKITALLMLTSFTHAFAMSPVQETSAMSKALERTFDEMNYSLNVEWDQKNQEFFKDKVEGFEKDIQSLQEQGLTNKELVDYTLAKIKDKQTQSDIKEIANVINESNMTSEQARDFVLKKLNGTYSQGTSWSGSRMGVKLVLILGLIILICCATRSNNHDNGSGTGHGDDLNPCGNDLYDQTLYGNGGHTNCDYPIAG